jgi:hypothetical protein
MANLGTTLGIDDFRAIGGERLAFLSIFFGNQLDDLCQLLQRPFSCWDECIAARDCRNLCYPGAVILPVEDRLVVVESHLFRP